MANPDVYEKTRNAVIQGNPEEVGTLVNEALQAGHDPVPVLKNGLVAGVKTVGEKFEAGELFLCDLIMAGDAMTAGSELLRGATERKTHGRGIENSAKVVVATVKDDIHDIGKNIVITMLKVGGFQVTDLGKDAPGDAIVKKVDEKKPSLVGLSALLKPTMIRQREAIAALVLVDAYSKAFRSSSGSGAFSSRRVGVSSRSVKYIFLSPRLTSLNDNQDLTPFTIPSRYEPA